jgi:hypothetical protein
VDIEWGNVLLIEYQMFNSPPAAPVIPAGLSGGLSSFLCPKVGGREWRAAEHAGSAGRHPEKDLCDLFGNVPEWFIDVGAVKSAA